MNPIASRLKNTGMPPVNPILGRLKLPTQLNTTMIQEPESQVILHPQGEDLTPRAFTTPMSDQGKMTLEHPVGENLTPDRFITPIQEDLTPSKLDMYIGPNAKGYDDLDPALHPEFSSLADRMRRKEISDADATLSPIVEQRLKGGGSVHGDLGAFLNHKQIYDMYPELKTTDTSLTRGNLPEHLAKLVEPSGSYQGRVDRSAEGLFDLTPEIKANAYTPEGIKSTLLHEIQHGIQEREGFAGGGSPNYSLASDADAWVPKWSVRAEVKELMDQGLPKEQIVQMYDGLPEQKDVSEYYDSFSPGGLNADMSLADVKNTLADLKKKQDPMKQYQNLAGEVEARDTQSRMNMSLQDRLKHEPLASQGVNPKDMIVRRLKGGVARSEGSQPQKITSLYHGTKATFSPQEIDFGKGRLRQGIYLTSSPDVAKTYGPNIHEYTVKPEAKTLDLSDGNSLLKYMKKNGIVESEIDPDLENKILEGRLFQDDPFNREGLIDDVLATAKHDGFDVVSLYDDLGNNSENIATVVLNKNVLSGKQLKENK